jgi:serine phosphatase RsbU (regulator of sigma subunit)
MAMVAHAAIKIAIAEQRWRDPADMLSRADEVVRAMFPQAERIGQLATNMDMSLCYVDLAQGELVFAGAKLALMWSDGGDCVEVRGDRRAINDRIRGQFRNERVPLQPGRTFYLITDGVLDQTGGDRGFSYGRRRIIEWVKQNATAPMEAQREELARELDAFSGTRPQLDDITVLAFRVDASKLPQRPAAGES